MDNDIKHVHVGQAIDKRRNELGLSKSEDIIIELLKERRKRHVILKEW